MIFIDASFVIGLINPKDQWHNQAKKIYQDIKNEETVISNVILTETINSIKLFGGKVGEVVYKTLKDQNKIIYLNNEKIFDKAMKIYLKFDGTIGFRIVQLLNLWKNWKFMK